MSELDKAMERMAAAVSALEAEIKAGAPKGEDRAVPPELLSERDQLAHEVRSLRERAKEDAKLRAEAAVAVREALNDLRGVVNPGAEHA